MLNEFLKDKITSQAEFIKKNGYGYGQVEPNHLSAQRNGQIYAQLPAAAGINVLEQGQFVKYDYAKGVVDFDGEGEWMLVYNEIKLYRDNQMDCEFAMLKDNYQARVYSPAGEKADKWEKQSRYYNGVDAEGNAFREVTLTDANAKEEDGFYIINGKKYAKDIVTKSDNEYTIKYAFDDITAAPDMYELHYNEDPFHILSKYTEKMMPAGTTMVPRVLKTMPGDHYTTNMLGDEEYKVGDIVAPRAADGILAKAGDTTAMKWQVVKIYTMPDHQPGVKVMRIA